MRRVAARGSGHGLRREVGELVDRERAVPDCEIVHHAVHDALAGRDRDAAGRVATHLERIGRRGHGGSDGRRADRAPVDVDLDRVGRSLEDDVVERPRGRRSPRGHEGPAGGQSVGPRRPRPADEPAPPVVTLDGHELRRRGHREVDPEAHREIARRQVERGIVDRPLRDGRALPRELDPLTELSRGEVEPAHPEVELVTGVVGAVAVERPGGRQAHAQGLARAIRRAVGLPEAARRERAAPAPAEERRRQQPSSRDHGIQALRSAFVGQLARVRHSVRGVTSCGRTACRRTRRSSSSPDHRRRRACRRRAPRSRPAS
jgi:hypothetical protein